MNKLTFLLKRTADGGQKNDLFKKKRNRRASEDVMIKILGAFDEQIIMDFLSLLSLEFREETRERRHDYASRRTRII